MRHIEQEELKKILKLHRNWVFGEVGGQRADLQGANLRGADLQPDHLELAKYEAQATRASFDKSALKARIEKLEAAPNFDQLQTFIKTAIGGND